MGDTKDSKRADDQPDTIVVQRLKISSTASTLLIEVTEQSILSFNQLITASNA